MACGTVWAELAPSVIPWWIVIVMAYMRMAYVVMALYRYDLYSYGLRDGVGRARAERHPVVDRYSYGLYTYGLYSYGPIYL